jgi:hypothetical protein
MRDAMRQRIGLARTGASDDQKRRRGDGFFAADAMFDGPTLLAVEFFQMRGAQRFVSGAGANRRKGNRS